MSESKITTIFKGEYVQVDMVDKTIELTVENNVYSRSESLELLEELKRACAASRNDFGTAKHETYSQKMQDALEPIEEPLSSKAKLYDETGIASSGSYKNHLPRLMEEMENQPVGGMITHIGGVPVDWTFHTTDDDCEFEDTGRVD